MDLVSKATSTGVGEEVCGRQIVGSIAACTELEASRDTEVGAGLGSSRCPELGLGWDPAGDLSCVWAGLGPGRCPELGLGGI